MLGIGFLAGACWAAYILLTQRVGDALEGFTGLAISMPIAGLVSFLVAGPSLVGELDLELLAAGLALALLPPVIPFALELLALRRLTTTAFGTLMSIEPAFAVLVGLVALGQVTGPLPVVGVLLVVAAGSGRAARVHAPPSPTRRSRWERPRSAPRASGISPQRQGQTLAYFRWDGRSDDAARSPDSSPGVRDRTSSCSTVATRVLSAVYGDLWSFVT